MEVFAQKNLKVYLTSILTVLLFAGCSTPHRVQSFTAALDSGDLTGAAEIATKEKNSMMGADKLRWGLEVASINKYLGKLEKSNEIFDATEELIKDEEVKNIANKSIAQVGSILANDNVTNYKPTQYDRVMVNTYKALSFWQQQDHSNARVEWNRVDERQRRAVEYFSKQIKEQQKELAENKDGLKSYNESMKVLQNNGVNVEQWTPYSGYINPFALYMHGLYFALNADSPSDKAKAKDSLKRLAAMTKNSQVLTDLQNINRKGKLDDGVWIIFENGLVGKKYEKRIDLPLFILSGDVNYVGIALPLLNNGKSAYQYISANGVKTSVLASMDKVVQGEFKVLFKGIVAKEILRTLVKTGVQVTAKKENELLGTAFSIFQAVTTQADLRSWHTLPYDFQVAKINTPKNKQVKLAFANNLEQLIDLPEDTKSAVIYIRALSSAFAPSISVLSTKN